nr:hypothetical protein [Actinomycetota bacterium]
MESIVFDDFSGGWRGTLDLAKCPPNMHDGRNVLIYRDGSLGPRPGLKAFNVGYSVAQRVRGALHTGHPVRPLVWVEGTTVFATSDDGLGNAVSVGTLAGPPVNDMPLKMTKFTGRQSFMSVPGAGAADRVYWIHHNGAATLLQNLGGAGGYCNSPYGVRLITGNSASALINFSAAMNGAVWPAANTIRLAFDGIPIHLSEQRNHLVAVLDDGSWFVLTGVPGVNDTLRRVAGGQVYPAPLGYDAFLDTGDDIINFLSPSGNFPGSFDGANLSELPYLSMTPENPRQSYAEGGFVVAARAVKAIQGSGTASPGFILRDPVNRLLLKHNGAWGLHQFGVPVGQAWAFNGQGRLIGFDPDKASGAPLC